MKLITPALLILLALPMITQAETPTPPSQADDLAFTRPGSSIFFQFGLFYSEGYGNIIDRYDTENLLPGSIFGADEMTRFGYNYNYNDYLGLEFAFSDNGVDFADQHKDIVDSGTTQAQYNFDIYNLETALVLKNSFADLNSEIHAKFGAAYTYGKQTVSYHTSDGSGPSWNDGKTQFEQQYHAAGIAPLFGVGFSWSISQYLAYSFDYEHVFKPIIGNANYNDPLNSSMQATNMWLLGINYHF